MRMIRESIMVLFVYIYALSLLILKRLTKDVWS